MHEVTEMYNQEMLNTVVDFIYGFDGINDKDILTKHVVQRFALTTDRKVYYCDSFAIRFSRSSKRNFGNTVLSLSALQKYDNRPFLVCVVTPTKNYILLANTTFLSKISHSSQELRVNNIKGSFNGTDIMRNISGLDNTPDNFDDLYATHESFTFEENLERLVEATNNIVGTGKRFEPTDVERNIILDAPLRAKCFLFSKDYHNLDSDLSARVLRVQNEIAIAAFIPNVNLRGRIIEFLISSNPCDLREQLIKSLNEAEPFPEFVTRDTLGDYSKQYTEFITETDIKTKILFLSSNPKAYNIDKLLYFLAQDKSVYMIYIVGIDENKNIHTKLCSIFQSELLSSTSIIQHWAGRNSRGVTQFRGQGLNQALETDGQKIEVGLAVEFIKTMMDSQA